jgi:hypothetical protein
MKALTLWQPWASLIAAGAKSHEFRSWPAPRWVVGQRIAIHAGARKVRMRELVEILDSAIYEPGFNGLDVAKVLDVCDRKEPHDFILSAVVCTAVIGNPISPEEVARKNDSTRHEHFNWAWPLTAVERFEPPVPARGAQGFWEWAGA